MEQSDRKYAVLSGFARLVDNLSEAAAKSYAEGALRRSEPKAANSRLEWTPHGHLFYDDGGALVPSMFCIAPQGEASEQPTPEHAPFLAFSSMDLGADARFLITSASLAPRLYTLDDLISYMRDIWNFEDTTGEDDALWALLPGLVTPFQMFISESTPIESHEGKTTKVASQLVIHIPMGDSDAREGLEILVVFRNGLRSRATLKEIKHSVVIMTMEGKEETETIHWTAIRALYRCSLIGTIEWEVQA